MFCFLITDCKVSDFLAVFFVRSDFFLLGEVFY